MTTAAKLYTPEILGLATELARYPLGGALPLRGEARSSTCGSSLVIGLRLDPAGRIGAVGVRAQACAIGQAAAAIFAQSAIGLDRSAIASADTALRDWLAGKGGLADWPDLAALVPAYAYPARHGAIRLAWQAALAALPTG